MARIVYRAALAACLAGAVLAGGSARADAPRAAGLTCAGPANVLDRPSCRPARHALRRIRTERPLVAVARLPWADPTLFAPDPVYRLLILGVGY